MPRALSPWYARVAPYLLAAGAFIVVRWLHTKYLGWGTGYDVGLYQSYGRSWGSGAAPYVGFSPEYPPGALYLFLVPHLFSDSIDYARAFAYEMALFDLLSCMLVVAWARRLFSARTLPTLASTALYLALSTALFPVLYTRFDLAPAALTLLALYLVYGRYPGWGAALLGVGGAVKLWPFALVPLYLVKAYREGGLLRVARAGLFVGIGIAAAALPMWPRAGASIGRFLEYHSARGIEVGSTWASMAFVLDLLHLSPAQPHHDFGAFHVAGHAAALFVRVSTAATLLLAIAPAVWGWFAGVGRAEDRRGAIGLRVATATALGFMIGGKVLSPQFALWIAPLLPLVATGPVSIPLSLAACVLTTVEYPYTSAALEMLAPGHATAVVAIVTRNLMLVALYAAMLRRPRRPQAGAAGAGAAASGVGA